MPESPFANTENADLHIYQADADPEVVISDHAEEVWKGSYSEYGKLLGVIQGERKSLKLILQSYGLDPKVDEWVEDMEFEILASLFQLR